MHLKFIPVVDDAWDPHVIVLPSSSSSACRLGGATAPTSHVRAGQGRAAVPRAGHVARAGDVAHARTGAGHRVEQGCHAVGNGMAARARAEVGHRVGQEHRTAGNGMIAYTRVGAGQIDDINWKIAVRERKKTI